MTTSKRRPLPQIARDLVRKMDEAEVERYIGEDEERIQNGVADEIAREHRIWMPKRHFSTKERD